MFASCFAEARGLPQFTGSARSLPAKEEILIRGMPASEGTAAAEVSQLNGGTGDAPELARRRNAGRGTGTPWKLIEGRRRSNGQTK